MPSPLPETDAASHLDLIVEMTGDFAHSHDVERTLRRGLERIARRAGAEAGSLFLVDEGTGELVCHACFGPVDVTGLRLAAGTGIIGRALDLGTTQLVRDCRHDPDFAHMVDAATGFETRSILCAPLAVRNRKLGAIELFNKVGGDAFGTGDSRLLQAMAASAALALINARLLEEMAEQQGLQRELELASDIQRAMLPPPQPASSPIHGVNLAARGVSGDFYEIMPLADGRIAFAVGDVSGKGMNASLLMTKTASLFRCLAKRESGPGRVLAAIDAELHETSLSGMFVTMAAGVLDPARGRVVLANAGHEPPLLLRDGGFTAFEGEMPPLGIAPGLFDGGCPETELELKGGTLYLFTDGLTEARAASGAMLGAEGARSMLLRFAAMPAAMRLDALVRCLDQGGNLRDDVTLLAVEDRREAARPGFSRLFAAHAEELAATRAALSEALRDWGCEAPLTADMVLAVDEACQNIIRHAYKGGEGDIILHAEKDGGRLVLLLMDFAATVDAAKIAPRPLDELRPGGLGTHFMRSVMDSVEFLPPPAGVGNLLRMVKEMRAP